MSEKVIKPDLRFVKSVVNSGGDSLKKCYQCATCSVVCNVTPEENPFPRKEMIQAQWGLKEDLFRNPDIWLCHHCSDCTAYCPRGAKPGEVLGAIRKMSLEHYSRPGFLARMVNDPKYLVLLLALPVVIFLLIASGFSSLNFSEIPRGEYGGIVFSNFIPVPAIDITFGLAALFALVVFVGGVLRYWKDMTRGEKLAGGLVGSVITTIGEILGHGRFRKCDLTRPRSTSHMLVLFSFIGLAVTTTWALIYLYGLGWDSPYPMTDPLKVLANLSAIALLVGVGLVIANRVNKAEKAGMGSYYDWLFIGVVATIVVTGALSELTRLGNIAGLAYPIYLTHLVAVFFLFAYAPFSKMAHMVYRTTAMVYARTAGRK
ncbi:MAG: quinone-interacting membrane-bound oxidoreductase complex subunit QmoC [Nitrospirota bacterium]|jgi:quinone-modifying oxidoreductase subunit QmoC